MPEQTPTTYNNLEKYLIDLHQGLIKNEDFLKLLLGTQVFMPIDDDESEVTGFQTDSKANPLTVMNENDDVTLTVFSSPDRSKTFIKNFPKFNGGILVEFNWILERIGKGIVVSINPEWDFGIDFEPDMVEQLIQMNTASANQQPNE